MSVNKSYLDNFELDIEDIVFEEEQLLPNISDDISSVHKLFEQTLVISINNNYIEDSAAIIPTLSKMLNTLFDMYDIRHSDIYTFGSISTTFPENITIKQLNGYIHLKNENFKYDGNLCVVMYFDKPKFHNIRQMLIFMQRLSEIIWSRRIYNNAFGQFTFHNGTFPLFVFPFDTDMLICIQFIPHYDWHNKWSRKLINFSTKKVLWFFGLKTALRFKKQITDNPNPASIDFTVDNDNKYSFTNAYKVPWWLNHIKTNCQ